MSSRTSSRSTLTMVPSTMSPSLKYLIVESMAARKSSADPMSLMATCGAVTVGVDMGWGAPDGVLSGSSNGSTAQASRPLADLGGRRHAAGRFRLGDLERRPRDPSPLLQGDASVKT